MQIVIIGTGNTATVLARKLKQAGHNIVQVYGRNAASAAALAAALHTDYCSEWTAITQQAELYIIALADSALTGNDIQLKLTDQLVVHTAGAVTMEVLKNISPDYGVLYPYQTLRKEIDYLPPIPFLIDASTEKAKEQLLHLAESISTAVSIAGDAVRMKYHLCAVIANNFSNYLFTLTEAYCRKNDLDFNNLLPLIDETARRLHLASPAAVQTGPAIRNDGSTINRHLQLLRGDAALHQWYQLFTDEIQAYRW